MTIQELIQAQLDNLNKEILRMEDEKKKTSNIADKEYFNGRILGLYQGLTALNKLLQSTYHPAEEAHLYKPQ